VVNRNIYKPPGLRGGISPFVLNPYCMCGIAGQYLPKGGSIDRDLLRRMSDLLAHRGPDGEGIYSEGPIGLAHRRLAIIDLSEEGSQPMANESGSLWMVFNGEIYNYRELMADLSARGHTFRSRTDSEVILHAYEEWGSGCLERMNGMWAFAIWDADRKELFCARDRIGIKPFYYTLVGGAFLFASEIKALRAHPDVGRRPNDARLLSFLAWGLADHTDETMFEGIFQLPAGHYIRLAEGDAVQPVPYWHLSVNPDHFTNSGADDRLSGKFLDLLMDAVRLHLRSDVPVGTCLSGGLDSSTIAALMNRLLREESGGDTPAQQNTFSACFSDKRFDESSFVDVFVKATGVRSHLLYPDPKEIWTDLDHLLWINDEPFAALTIYSQYCVMREASARVKVVLDGQGADELLAGYIAYQFCHLRGMAKDGLVITALREISGTLRHHRSFIRYALGQLVARSGRRNFIRGSPEPLPRYQGTLSEALATDFLRTNLPYLLHWEDRTSMAFSIEARVPYLDYRMVEFVASLAEDQKIRGGITKYIMRRAVRGLIPEAIRCRMDKKGFSTPEEVWMKEELRPRLLELFASESFARRPYWDAEAVMSDYRKYLNDSSPYSSELWRIACTELWLRRFFDEQRRA
jgi:asparagine synthase (glutamine-hydrolysing)